MKFHSWLCCSRWREREKAREETNDIANDRSTSIRGYRLATRCKRSPGVARSKVHHNLIHARRSPTHGRCCRCLTRARIVYFAYPRARPRVYYCRLSRLFQTRFLPRFIEQRQPGTNLTLETGRKSNDACARSIKDSRWISRNETAFLLLMQLDEIEGNEERERERAVNRKRGGSFERESRDRVKAATSHRG